MTLRVWTCGRLVVLALLVSAAASAASAPAGSDRGDPVPRDLLFARLTTERTERFPQEIFDFILSVYSRGLTMGRETAVLGLEASGLNILPVQDLGTGREAIDGKFFDVHRFLGRAQAAAAGTFVLQPVVRVEVVVARRGGVGGPSGRADVRQTDLSPPPLAVQVRPLPETGKPAGFTGGVGSFAFSATARPSSVAEGDPVSLVTEIRGRGNIEALAAPAVPTGERFKTYEPKQLTKELSEDRSGGRVVFEQIVIPSSAASTPLPAVQFHYFDPTAKSYRKLVAGPFPLTVTRAARPREAAVSASSAAPGARKPAPGPEIAGIKPGPDDWSGQPARPWRPPLRFIVLQLVPPGILAALILGVRRRNEQVRDLAGARRRLAPKAARAGIGAAEQALRRGDPSGFHDALWEALSAYFSHRLDLLPGEISAEAVTEKLSRAGLDAQDLARLSEIFRVSEHERFGRPTTAAAPLSAGERQRLAGMLDELGRLLRACEKLGL